jgi:hypothetical protein
MDDGDAVLRLDIHHEHLLSDVILSFGLASRVGGSGDAPEGRVYLFSTTG